jgi:hypothetical protein
MKRAAAFLLFATLACTTARQPFVADEATRAAIAQIAEAVGQNPTRTSR